MSATRSGLFVDGAAVAASPTEPGVTRQVLVHTAQMMVTRVAFEKGAVGAAHRHVHVQASYVASGVFDVTIDGRTERLSAGSAFIVPSNLLHGVTAVEAGVLIDSFTPRREEFLPAP